MDLTGESPCIKKKKKKNGDRGRGDVKKREEEMCVVVAC